MKNIVGDKLHLVVDSITEVADSIKRFTFVDKEGGDLPVYAGGAHVVITMHDGKIIRRNPYSLMGNINDKKSYSISVLRLPDGRGGSRFMHDNLKVGMEVTVSYPVNLFGLDWRARKHLLIAGGIGITPIMSQADALSERMLPFDMHYIVRSEARGAYAKELKRRYDSRFNFYIHNNNNQENRHHSPIDLYHLLENQPIGTHAYVCGPLPLIESIISICKEIGWDKEALHYEQFLAPPTGKPYTLDLQISKKILTVASNQSMLETIEMAGIKHPYLCRGGACGQCETDVISYKGTLAHNDHFLTDEEKQSGKKIMPCVSRVEGDGAHIVLER